MRWSLGERAKDLTQKTLRKTGTARRSGLSSELSRGIYAVFVLIAGWWLGVSALVVQAQSVIPKVHGEALTGERVELPEALKGKVGVLVVGFSQASRGQVTAWGKRLAEDYRDSGAVVYYEMPVLASVPRLLRGWVVKKIAAEVPDRAKGRFLPLYDHEAEWRVAAGYSRMDDAYVLVVDGEGLVRFRTEGEANDEAYAEVKKRVAGMH